MDYLEVDNLVLHFVDFLGKKESPVVQSTSPVHQLYITLKAKSHTWISKCTLLGILLLLSTLPYDITQLNYSCSHVYYVIASIVNQMKMYTIRFVYHTNKLVEIQAWHCVSDNQPYNCARNRKQTTLDPSVYSSHDALSPRFDITKKITVTRQLQKLQKEVGMAVPKSTQTRMV